MSMSKKHYQTLAAALYQERKYRGEGHATFSDAVRVVARVLAADNSRFNRDLFLEACETGQCRGMRQVR